MYLQTSNRLLLKFWREFFIFSFYFQSHFYIKKRLTPYPLLSRLWLLGCDSNFSLPWKKIKQTIWRILAFINSQCHTYVRTIFWPRTAKTKQCREDGTATKEYNSRFIHLLTCMYCAHWLYYRILFYFWQTSVQVCNLIVVVQCLRINFLYVLTYLVDVLLYSVIHLKTYKRLLENFDFLSSGIMYIVQVV